MNTIPMGDPVSSTIDTSKVGIKRILDGKIDYRSNFNKKDNRNLKVGGAQF